MRLRKTRLLFLDYLPKKRDRPGWHDLLGSLHDPRDEGLDALVRHEDDSLSGDNSPQPGHHTLVQALRALGLDDLLGVGEGGGRGG